VSGRVRWPAGRPLRRRCDVRVSRVCGRGRRANGAGGPGRVRREGFEVVEAGLWALMPGDRNGSVEGDDGGRGQCEELVVEQAHLAPVGLLKCCPQVSHASRSRTRWRSAPRSTRPTGSPTPSASNCSAPRASRQEPSTCSSGVTDSAAAPRRHHRRTHLPGRRQPQGLRLMQSAHPAAPHHWRRITGRSGGLPGIASQADRWREPGSGAATLLGRCDMRDGFWRCTGMRTFWCSRYFQRSWCPL
jgi:hypothetical protein